VKIKFDQAKSEKNVEKHGLPLDRFADLDLDAGIIDPDTRRDYGEDRYVVTAPLEGRLHVACFCIRNGEFRVISLRESKRSRCDAMSELKRKRRPKPLTNEDGQVRELALADFRRMKPVREAMPELIEAMGEFRKKVGRPRAEAPKVHIGFRLSADLVDHIRASGKGYNARVEKALREEFMRAEAVVVDRAGVVVKTGTAARKDSKKIVTKALTGAAEGPETKIFPAAYAEPKGAARTRPRQTRTSKQRA
jgi:uncharacterized DUF497 family protein